QGQRFFQVHVLLGGAGEHGHGRVPVVWRGDDDGVNGLEVQQFAKVGEALGPVAHRLQPFGQSAAVALGEGDEGDVLELPEGLDVPLAHEPVADEAEADAIVRTEDARVTGGREGGGGEEM